MDRNVGEMETEGSRAPDTRVNHITENEEWPEEPTVCLAPGHGEISADYLADLGKVIGEKVMAESI